MDLVKIGHWAFVLGLLIALIAGLGGEIPYMSVVLIIIGLIVGFLNVTEKESTPFLVAIIALLMIGFAGFQVGRMTGVVVVMLENIITFLAIAGLVVALKQVLTIARKSG
ncbi:MAG: hypothetical protein PHN37_02660 [Candidatus Pacebacteria bacterium]|jgi:hypothetical protein|nr:hypothetical protein [Candidatus Paceibacterota bacterium]